MQLFYMQVVVTLVRWLVSEGHVTCCTLNPGQRANIVAAGTKEGCLEIWDIRNQLSHSDRELKHNLGSKVKIFGTSYSTHEENNDPTAHISCIVSCH
jgi:hypothetical protein